MNKPQHKGEQMTISQNDHEENATQEETLRVFTPEEVATILKMSARTVFHLLREGDINGFRVGKAWRISERELRRLLRYDDAPSSEME